jgi:hypothetical protein
MARRGERPPARPPRTGDGTRTGGGWTKPTNPPTGHQPQRPAGLPPKPSSDSGNSRNRGS